MSDLTEFLLARIREDKATIFRETSADWQFRLAECEAKRRIVEHAEVAHERPCCRRSERDGAWFLALRYLALPYVDHPDFNPEWKMA